MIVAGGVDRVHHPPSSLRFIAHRVKDYRVGELERRYPRLPIEEAFFINYGFLPRETLPLLHPRGAPRAWDAKMQACAQEALVFVCRHYWRGCTIAGCCAWRGARAAPGCTRRSGTRHVTTAPRRGSCAPAICWIWWCNSTRRFLRPVWSMDADC
jgi:hypothetical protein